MWYDFQQTHAPTIMDSVSLLKTGIDKVIDRVRHLPDSDAKQKLLDARASLDDGIDVNVTSIVDVVIVFINYKIAHDYSQKSCMICCDPLDSHWDASKPYIAPTKLKCGSCFVHRECLKPCNTASKDVDFVEDDLFTCACGILHNHALGQFTASIIFKDNKKLNLEPRKWMKYFNILDTIKVSRGASPSRYAMQSVAALTRATDCVWKAVKCSCYKCTNSKTSMVFPVPSRTIKEFKIPNKMLATVDEFQACVRDAHCMLCMVIYLIERQTIDFEMIGGAIMDSTNFSRAKLGAKLAMSKK